jgi:hypothetical protein
VVNAVPLKFTTESAPKLLPFTVNVNDALPAVALVGLIEVIEGPGLTVKLVELEASPPEVTVTGIVPAVAIKLDGTAAVNCVLLTNVVARADPFHCTTAPDENPLPFTVSVSPGPPAVALFGEIELTAGRIEKFAAFEVDPPVVKVTGTVAAIVIKVAGTEAVT